MSGLKSIGRWQGQMLAVDSMFLPNIGLMSSCNQLRHWLRLDLPLYKAEKLGLGEVYQQAQSHQAGQGQHQL